jgi:KDO2-lipid IV(A) lauroyltransferase
MTNAPVILTYAERLSWGRGYIIRFVPLSALTSRTLAGTPAEQARVINQAMEKLISYCPAQYFWSYNRYKTPANAAEVSLTHHEEK